MCATICDFNNNELPLDPNGTRINYNSRVSKYVALPVMIASAAHSVHKYCIESFSRSGMWLSNDLSLDKTYIANNVSKTHIGYLTRYHIVRITQFRVWTILELLIINYLVQILFIQSGRTVVLYFTFIRSFISFNI